MTGARTAVAALVAGAVTFGLRDALGARTPGGAALWNRTNHRGEPISLLEGPAAVAGLAAGTAVGIRDPRVRSATVLAIVASGALGLVDDLAEDNLTRAKGLRGHLGALARGTVTTGGLKVLGIGVASLASAAIALPRSRGRATDLVDVVVGGALVAGTANLVNLLDVRPGRALKSAMLLSLPFLGSPAAPLTGAALGVASASAPRDLAEADMLGDSGANALGALVGTQLAFTAPRPVRWAALAGVVALTLASERVSFSRVIAETPVLRHLDEWGRRSTPERPSGLPGAASPADDIRDEDVAA